MVGCLRNIYSFGIQSGVSCALVNTAFSCEKTAIVHCESFTKVFPVLAANDQKDVEMLETFVYVKLLRKARKSSQLAALYCNCGICLNYLVVIIYVSVSEVKNVSVTNDVVWDTSGICFS